MGILNFHSWVKYEFNEAYIRFKSNNICQNIYIDVNFLLHNNIYFSRDENDFIKKLYHQFDIIFSNFIATNSILFCLDGVAPLAKIMVQTKRRANNKNKTMGEGLNNLWLTPGTKFMEKVHDFIKTYIKKLENREMTGIKNANI